MKGRNSVWRPPAAMAVSSAADSSPRLLVLASYGMFKRGSLGQYSLCLFFRHYHNCWKHVPFLPFIFVQWKYIIRSSSLIWEGSKKAFTFVLHVPQGPKALPKPIAWTPAILDRDGFHMHSVFSGDKKWGMCNTKVNTFLEPSQIREEERRIYLTDQIWI